MKQNIWLSILLTMALVSCVGDESTGEDSSQPNVLFIIIDDMNVDINCYGGPIKSPNIDRLAEDGIKFNNAYVQQPVCAASRASFLTGLRPNSTGVDYPYSHYFLEEVMPRHGTISRFFAQNGYHVKQFGKVHHGIEDENPTYKPRRKGRYYTEAINESVKNGGEKPPYEKTFHGDSEYADFKIADSVVSAILSNTKTSEPFFYVAGFHKPHLVFASPEKYWNMYNEEDILLPVPKNLAQGSPDIAVDRYYLNQYDWEHDDPLLPFSDDYARMIRHSYYASSSFVDAQVGLVMDALKESGLEEKTIVLFVSDHGFLMGEQNYWGKTNLYEKGLQVPLIVSWKNNIKTGLETKALVEAVDIFPTLVDLAGLEVPQYLEGTSFKRVIQDPGIPWKKAAISQQPRGLIADREGISLRTVRYRYTEWINTFTGEIIAQELFDYEQDPTESINLAMDPENAELLDELSGQLNAGWKAMLPEGVTNLSDNPVAPPSYAWGREGVSRRAEWHATFGGSEEEGWKKSTQRRNEYQKKHMPSLESKIEGMLIGSAIGDAAGGPVEFVVPPERSFWSTTDQEITREGIEALGRLFKLRPYPKDVEPFAQWEAYGPEGTITDDTRFKLILFNTLQNYDGELTQQNFAQSVLDFRETLPEKYKDNYDEWIPEIAFATNWALGTGENAYPVERIWGGIPTMEGQMPFIPIAALNPGDPAWCYLKTYELGYFDIGIAKDINSALVAGLARALQPDGNWENFEDAMRSVDPYKYNEVLYVDRQLIKWLDLSHHLVEKADGNIAKLFTLLEENLETTYWWEAWVPIVVVMACAEMVDYHPLASMQLMMEFGHDTDSYAQVMGAVLGAIHGKNVWPEEIRTTVNDRMKEQFDQNVDDWMNLITDYKQ